jgi:hypothetical protein
VSSESVLCSLSVCECQLVSVFVVGVGC